MKLETKVAIVTGGASGIGLAVTKDFLNNGAKVVVADRNEESRSVVEGLGSENVKFVKTDISVESEVINLIQETVRMFGKLDIMIANAGISKGKMIYEESLEEWNEIVGINLTGTFLCNKYAINEMLKSGGGSIVNTASYLAFISSPTTSAYAATKAGIVSLTKTAAVEYATKNIRINAVAPGYIETPLTEVIPEEIKNGLVSLYPMKRGGKPEEVASAIRYLASDEASFITGQTLIIDGGYTAK